MEQILFARSAVCSGAWHEFVWLHFQLHALDEIGSPPPARARLLGFLSYLD